MEVYPLVIGFIAIQNGDFIASFPVKNDYGDLCSFTIYNYIYIDTHPLANVSHSELANDHFE